MKPLMYSNIMVSIKDDVFLMNKMLIVRWLSVAKSRCQVVRPVYQLALGIVKALADG